MSPSATVAAAAAGLFVLLLSCRLTWRSAGRRFDARTPAGTASAAPAASGTTARRSDAELRSLPWRTRRRERQLDAAFPELLDLLVVSVQAGLLPAQALREARELVEPPLRDALDAFDTRLARGERFADALAALVDLLGPRALGLVATVVATDRHGLPLAPAVERLADDARSHRRRLAEATARELPVRMSFPLVLCTLPSFALVAIVPLLVGALSSLQAG